MKKKLKKLALKKSAVSHLQRDSILGGAAVTQPVTRCNCPPPATHRCTNKSKCCKYV